MDSRRNAGNETDRSHSSLLCAIAALLLTLGAASVCLGSTPTYFDIQAGDASATLYAFSQQAGLQLGFDFPLVRGRKTQAVKGTYEPQEALRQLLANTGLTFEFVNDRTLAVVQIKVASAAGSAQGPGAGTKHADRKESPPLAQRLPANVASLPDPFASIETIRITGTNLRGESPVGAQIVSMDRPAIEASGATTTAELLSTVSQMFGGGPTQDTHLGFEAQTNSGLGTGINLRGLGARATLILINGRRLAPSGTDAAFVDISSIPLSAVKRVDILPDAESALYGADAVGGVVNFIMRDDFTGSQTLLDEGTGPGGSLKSDYIAQTLGHKWGSGSAMASLEYYKRAPLPSSDRAYTANSDLTPFGGSNFDLPASNPGTLVLASGSYKIPAGQDGTHLSLSSLTPGQNLSNRFLEADSMPQQRHLSLYAAGRQDFDGKLSVFANVLFTDRRAEDYSGGLQTTSRVPTTNPFLPSGAGPGFIQYNFLDDIGSARTDVIVRTANLAVGADYELGGSWAVHAYTALARERDNGTGTGFVNAIAAEAALADPDPTTSLNLFGDGSHTNPRTLESLLSVPDIRLDSELKITDVTADGTLLRLPGGDLKLAAGLDLRYQYYFSLTAASVNLTDRQITQLSRRTVAGFSELVIPLFGKDNALPWLRRLEVSAAARYEDYEGFGHATTPKYGFAWSPVAGLSVRSTWSRALRAPTLVDLDQDHNVAQLAPLLSPSSPDGAVTALVWTGNNANLREERSKSWTAGFDFTPEKVKTLTLGMTWFSIDFSDRIESPNFTADALTNPHYANLVIRSPAGALVDDVCTHSILVSLSTAGCESLGAKLILDLRTHNVETLRTSGIDFDAKYEHAAGGGKLKMGLVGTYLLNYSLAEQNGSPDVNLLNTPHYPINLRLRAALGWDGPRLGWDAMLNYTNSYRDTVSQPNRPVAAWTTLDAQVHYEMGRTEGGWLQGIRLELNATNLFNRAPPFLNNQLAYVGYDQENADPYGRLVSVQIRKNW